MNRSIEDGLPGQVFGRLTVRCEAASVVSGHKVERRWVCDCNCGKTIITCANSLIKGYTKSCGCLNKEIVSNMMKTHGLTRTRLYRSWQNFKDRCYNPNNREYKNYGGRGIKVCDEWLGTHGFENFAKWAYEHGYDENKSRLEQSIERKNVNGNYEPSNCEWANSYVQNRNKRTNRLYTYNGKTMCLLDWATESGIGYSCLRKRLDGLKWSFEKAVTTPTRKLSKRGL